MCTHKSRLPRSLASLAAAAALAFTAAGCGTRNTTPSYNTTGTSSGALASASAFSVSEGDWVCPANDNYNVVPVSGSVTQTMSFKVCRSGATRSRFLITGASDSSVVCFFPMTRSASGSITPVEMPKCYDVSHGPVVADFTTTSINYMLSAAQANSNALAACLTSAASCPPYSAGAMP